jgi:type I restriction enzyme, S subunit
VIALDVSELPSSWKPASLGTCCDIVTSSMSYTDFLRVADSTDSGAVVCMAVKVSDMNLPGNEVAFVTANGGIKRLPIAVASRKLVPPNAVILPKRGAAIATNKKRLTTTWTALDPNLIALRAKDGVDARFLFYWSQTFDLRRITDPGPTPQLNKKDLVPVQLTLPSPEEQRQIAALLSHVQSALDRQERLVTLSAELKRTLMHRLFTEGTRGEPQEQTEIGLIPKSWGVEPLGQHLVTAQYGLSVKAADDGATPILRMTNQADGRIVATNLQVVNITEVERAKFRVEPFDILFNRTNSFELVGRTAIFELKGDFVFASYLIRLRTQVGSLRPAFLNHYFNWGAAQARLKGIASRAVSQSNISASRLRSFVVPLPSPEEQDEIVRCIDQIDRVRDVHQRRLSALQGLFRALLNQLMTARIRVDDLDLSMIEGAQPARAA